MPRVRGHRHPVIAAEMKRQDSLSFFFWSSSLLPFPPLGFWLIAKSFIQAYQDYQDYQALALHPQDFSKPFPRLCPVVAMPLVASCLRNPTAKCPPIYQASNSNPLPCQHLSPCEYEYEAEALPLHSPLPSNLTYLCRPSLPDFFYCCCRGCLSPVVIDFCMETS